MDAAVLGSVAAEPSYVLVRRYGGCSQRGRSDYIAGSCVSAAL